MRLLNQVRPIPKFIHFTSNEIMVRAFEGKDQAYIIDFDTEQVLQWPNLFQSLVSRHKPPSLIHVRITGIGESKQDLGIDLWMHHVKEGENVAGELFVIDALTSNDSSWGSLRVFLGL